MGPSIGLGKTFNDEVIVFEETRQGFDMLSAPAKSNYFVTAHPQAQAYVGLGQKLELFVGA